MSKIMHYSKRIGILLICLILLFGNLFIPVSAYPPCSLGHSTFQYQRTWYYTAPASYAYCTSQVYQVWYWCGKSTCPVNGPTTEADLVSHSFTIVNLKHGPCSKGCGYVGCNGGLCPACGN